MTPRSAAKTAARLDATRFADLATRYGHAWTRNQTANTDPDGLRAASYDGTSPGSCNCHHADDCPHGTPTERAALGRRERDELDGWVRDAGRAWAALLVAAADLERLLNNVEFRSKDAADLIEPPGCQLMERYGLPWEAVHASHTVDGQTLQLGQWAYRWSRAAGRFPNREECKQHAEGRNVRVRA